MTSHKGNLREGIQAKLNHLTDCIQRKDYHGIAERFWTNAKLMPSHEHDIVGVQRIESWYRHRLAMEEQEHTVVFEMKDLDDFDQIVAVAGSYTDLHDNVETSHGKFLMVLEKHPEDEHHKYKIHYLMFNSNQAPRARLYSEERPNGHPTEVNPSTEIGSESPSGLRRVKRVDRALHSYRGLFAD